MTLSASQRRYGGPGVTIGLTLIGHDISYTVLNGHGVPLLVAEEERYSRRKKGSFVPPLRRVYDILAEAGIEPADVRHLAVANVPALMEQRPPESRLDEPCFGPARMSEALLRALTVRLCDLDSVVWVRHHLCHAASAFLPSPFETAGVITVDGMGEDETATVWLGEGTRLHRRLAIRHPHSLGYLYQAIAQWAGMTGAEREGKLMGLAALGQPRYLDTLKEHFLRPEADGTFRVTEALARQRCDNATWIAWCESHLGPRRAPDGPLEAHHMNVAASVQVLLEEVLLGFLRLARQLTGARHACLAGGVFMNSKANGRLRREGPFEDLWVQPMASDNGLSLGAALWSHVGRVPGQPRWRMTSPFLGSALDETEVRDLLKRHGVAARRCDDVERVTARLLASGRLVGWVQGRSEVGARALGHRSILADPRDSAMKNRLNAAIKRREPWRPFAPMVLEDEAARLFTDPSPSPFMMFVADAFPRAPIPAALHVNGAARLQTVNSVLDARLHQLLCEFRTLTGVGALLNTSFNVRGEPIVRTAEEAWRIFAGSGMDVLVLGDYVIEKPEVAKCRGTPVEAAAPRVEVSSSITSALEVRRDVVVAALGSAELLKRVLELGAALNRAPRVLHPPCPGELSYPFRLETLQDGAGRVVAIAEVKADLLLVLLPTWVEVAVELMPNLLQAFVALVRGGSCEVLMLDEAGGAQPLGRVLDEWDRAGPRGAVSQAEHFWLIRRERSRG